MKNRIGIRPFATRDVPALFELMKALARFEGYIDGFSVTEDILYQALTEKRPAFTAFVAEQQCTLVGYAVCYTIPFTYDLRPTVILKELYVSKAARGTGAGQALFDRVKLAAQTEGAARLQWLVLPDNHAAKQFYVKQGGKVDPNWEHWELPVLSPCSAA